MGIPSGSACKRDAVNARALAPRNDLLECICISFLRTMARFYHLAGRGRHGRTGGQMINSSAPRNAYTLSEPCSFTILLYMPRIKKVGAHCPMKFAFFCAPAMV